MGMEWDGDLDDLPRGAIQGLADAFLGSGQDEGTSGGVHRRKIRIGLKSRPKPVGKGLKYFEPDLTNGNYNKNVTIEVELPAYLVMAMHEINGPDLDEAMRLAVREYLEARHVYWWYPRFLISGKYDVSSAKDRFTRRVGLE